MKSGAKQRREDLLLPCGVGRAADAKSLVWVETSYQFQFQLEVARPLLAGSVTGPPEACDVT